MKARASLDTNALIHFYRAGLQNILFDFFEEGVFIYEQIRDIELENHGQDVLILRYLSGDADESQTVRDFNTINKSSDMNWSFDGHIRRFIKRFWKDPYRKEDVIWMRELVDEKNIKVRSKLSALSSVIRQGV